MNFDSGIPDDILDAVRFIKEAGRQQYLTRMDKDNINRAKLKIAFWALKTENVAASRENLGYMLGPDAAEIMGAYDRYLERDDNDTSEVQKKSDTAKKKTGGSGFWENA